MDVARRRGTSDRDGHAQALQHSLLDRPRRQAIADAVNLDGPAGDRAKVRPAGITSLRHCRRIVVEACLGTTVASAARDEAARGSARASIVGPRNARRVRELKSRGPVLVEADPRSRLA